MNTELRKRLEEAAEQAGMKAFNNAYDDLETGEVCVLCQEVAYNNYRQGFEHGYKEAVNVAKEWLKSSFFQCLGEDDNIHWDSSYDDITEALNFFEADMNKP